MNVQSTIEHEPTVGSELVLAVCSVVYVSHMGCVSPTVILVAVQRRRLLYDQFATEHVRTQPSSTVACMAITSLHT